MAASEKDKEHFRQIGKAFEELDDERRREHAKLTPGQRLERGLRHSDEMLALAARDKGGLGQVTRSDEETLQGQASLLGTWLQAQAKKHP